MFMNSEITCLYNFQDMKHVLTTIGEKMSDFEVDQILKLSGAVEGNAINYHSKYTLSI